MPGDVVPEPQICRRIDLMEFLAFEEGAVVLEPERHDSADSDAHACPRLEFPLVLGTGEIALQRGVGEQLDRTKTSLESWRQLEGPRALAERRPRRLVFGAESKTHGQPPGLGLARRGHWLFLVKPGEQEGEPRLPAGLPRRCLVGARV